MAKKLAKKSLSKQDKDLYSKLKKAKVQLIQQEKEIQEDFKDLSKETRLYKDAVVMINDAVYPRTFIRIFDHQTEVEDEYMNIRYKYTDKGIIAEDMGDTEDEKPADEGKPEKAEEDTNEQKKEKEEEDTNEGK